MFSDIDYSERLMFIKNQNDCEEFSANDGCRIRELLHPSQDPVNLPYSLAIAKVDAGKQSYTHKLMQDEVYYIMQGEGRMHVNDDVRTVSNGDVVYIPAGSPQWIENTGASDLIFAAIVNPPWTKQGDTRLDAG